METKPIASVVMTVRNVSTTIVDCLQAILRQTFSDFEVIIIDDFSTDDTRGLIQKFNDKRIKYFKNEKWLGISPSRNRGLEKAAGEYVFFTDGDCIVSENWIEMGVKYLQNLNCVAVEGRIYYVSENYEPTFSDHVMENRNGGNFMTGNMAYKKEFLKKTGGFDNGYTYFEDRDVAFRLMKYGRVCFNPEMIVYHPRVVNTPKKLIASAANVKNLVRFYRKFGRAEFMLWRILYPRYLIRLLCPPLVFSSLLLRTFKNSDDFRLLPFTYVYLISQRLQLWKECARERVLII